MPVVITCSTNLTVLGTGHQIKKLVDHETGTFRLVIYLGFSEQPMFCLLEPHIKDGRYHLDHICSISAPSEDLIDYYVTPSLLWSLWTDTEGEMIARVAMLQGEPARGDNWMPVLLDPPATADILIPAHKDPREVYMDLIFQPGQFSTRDIQKALNVRRIIIQIHAAEKYYVLTSVDIIRMFLWSFIISFLTLNLIQLLHLTDKAVCKNVLFRGK